jgi:hypothetical protein
VEACVPRADEAPDDTCKDKDRDAVPGHEVGIVPNSAGIPC